jgi:RNA polymerase sigma factor (sigma-70 family)
VTDQPGDRVELLLRELAPLVLGAVTRRSRDFAEAEDAVQEALIAAAGRWSRDGIPANPRGWLTQVARRRLVDHVRSEVARRHREDAAAAEVPVIEVPAQPADTEFDPADTLVLLFMCCHPSLTPSSAVALTLRAVGGLTTGEIARAFLVPESTIGQRISRAKQTIRSSGEPFTMPEAADRTARLASVLQVLYLIFNEGYTATSGPELQRVDLSSEAIRLTRQLGALLPESGDAAGLLALMLLTDARRAARTGPGGELIPLDEQDRSRWNQAMIAEGVSLASGALSKGSVGQYQLQAAIAAVHDEAARAEDTDWPQIQALYQMLGRVSDNPMVALNHAIATAMIDGPEVGLTLLTQLEREGRLQGSHRLDAVRAHLLERAGRPAEALGWYQRAATRTASIPERDYLLRRAQQAQQAAAPGQPAPARSFE